MFNVNMINVNRSMNKVFSTAGFNSQRKGGVLVCNVLRHQYISQIIQFYSSNFDANPKLHLDIMKHDIRHKQLIRFHVVVVSMSDCQARDRQFESWSGNFIFFLV